MTILKRLKLLTFAAALALSSAAPQLHAQYQCVISGQFTSDGQVSASLANYNKGCMNWRLTYSVSGGPTTYSIQVEVAPNSSGSAGTFAAVASSTVTDGSNPMTNTDAGTMAFHSNGGFFRVKSVSHTGANFLTYYQLTGALGATAQQYQAPVPITTFANLPSSAPNGQEYQVSDVGISGSMWEFNTSSGKWGLQNGRTTLIQSGMPWVVIGSGSVAANGVLSGFLALPSAYARAWFYMPANALDTVSAAGWYYGTCTTTTACTVTLTGPGTTFPVSWPSSPTAVTNGRGAYTGVSGGTVISLPNITLPANALGINGRISNTGASTSSGGASTNSVGFSYSSCNVAANNNAAGFNLTFTQWMVNRGNASVQQTYGFGTTSGSTASFTSASNCTINSASSQTITPFIQNIGGIGTTNSVFESMLIELYNDGQ